MGLRLKNRTGIPYGGNWYYKDPFSGMEFYFYQFDGLLEKIRQHRIANGFPIGLGFEEEIEQQVATNHPDEAVDLPHGIPYRKSIGISDVIRGTKVMIASAIAGRPLVDRAEAERRAKICLKCQLNDDFSRPCSIGMCPELKNVVSAFTGNVGTQYDAQLKQCRICSCWLQSAIWFPLEIQCKGVTEEMKEHFVYAKEKFGCWKQC